MSGNEVAQGVPEKRRLTKIRVFLADDQAILTEALKTSLSTVSHIDVVGTAFNGRDAMDQIALLKPDIGVLDISMPGLDGLEISRQVNKYYPQTQIILLSSYDDDRYVKDAIQAGVRGYVLKTASHHSLVDAIEAAVRGEIYLSPQITSQIIGNQLVEKKVPDAELKTRFDLLSDREREILRLITEGKTQRDIASLLFLSQATVKSHRHNIMKKLGVHKSVDLVRHALKSGIIKM